MPENDTPMKPGDELAPTPVGAPADASEDEFAGIEPYRPRRSPILALVVIAISGYLMVHLRYDLAYALRSRRPQVIDDVRAFFRDTSHIRDNSYVTVRGVPDRAHAIMLDVKGKDEFIPFERIMGTGSRLLLAQRRGLRPLGDVYDDRYAGRLMRLADVSYAATVSDYYARKVTATRFFLPADVRAALGQVPARLHDLAGDAVVLDARRVMAVDVAYRGDYDLTLPRERFPVEADGRVVLDRLRVQVKEASETNAALHFVVRIEDARRDAVIGQLRQMDPRIEVRRRKRTYEAPWGDFRAAADGLSLPAPAGGAERVVVSWDDIATVKTVESLKLPADAFVLVEGERPQDLWYVPLFAVCFLGFIVWNALALWAARGRRAPARKPA